MRIINTVPAITITMPDEVVYVKDSNCIVFQPNEYVDEIYRAEVYMIIHYTKNGNSLTQVLRAESLGSQLVVDLSVLIRRWGFGVDITSVDFAVWTYPVGASFPDSTTQRRYPLNGLATLPEMTIHEGFSLPNKQHFSETGAYIPPIDVYRAAIDEGAEESVVEFGSPADIIINGERYYVGETFTLSAGDGCSNETTVQLLNPHKEWQETPKSWAMGCTHIIIDRVNFVKDGVLWSLLQDNNIMSKDDEIVVSGWVDKENTCIVGMVIEPTIYNGVFKICGLTKVKYGEQIEKYHEELLALPVDLYLICDIEDDFFNNNYCPIDGHRKVIGYKVYTSPAGGEVYDDLEFYIQPMTSEIADREDLCGIMFCFNNITNGLNNNDYFYSFYTTYQHKSSYDYTLIGTETTGRYELFSLCYGTHIVGTGSPVYNLPQWFRTFTINGGYTTLCEPDINYTYFIRLDNTFYVGSQDGVPKYALWRFFNVVESGQDIEFNLVGNELRPFSAYANVWSNVLMPVKMKDYSLSFPQGLNKSSFLKFQSAKMQIKHNGTETVETIYNEIYLYPSSYLGGYYRSSDYVLRDTNNQYVDVYGNPSADPIYISVCGYADGLIESWGIMTRTDIGEQTDVVINNLTIVGLDEDSWKVTLTLSSLYNPIEGEVAYSIHYMPYICDLPYVYKNTEEEPIYSGQWSMITALGTIAEKYGFYVNRYYASPINVGRATYFNNVTYPNTPNTRIDHNRFSRGVLINDSDLNGYRYLKPFTINGKWNNRPLSYSELLQMFDNYKTTHLFDHPTDFTVTSGDLVEDGCEETNFNIFSTEDGNIGSYSLLTYNLCNDNVNKLLWLHYKNMDGFDRFLPCIVKESEYKNTKIDIAYTIPNRSVINSYPLYTPNKLQEKITVYITDVPQNIFIEDILYSPILDAYSYDGTGFFACDLEEDTILRRRDDMYSDYVLHLIKKV